LREDHLRDQDVLQRDQRGGVFILVTSADFVPRGTDKGGVDRLLNPEAVLGVQVFGIVPGDRLAEDRAHFGKEQAPHIVRADPAMQLAQAFALRSPADAGGDLEVEPVIGDDREDLRVLLEPRVVDEQVVPRKDDVDTLSNGSCTYVRATEEAPPHQPHMTRRHVDDHVTPEDHHDEQRDQQSEDAAGQQLAKSAPDFHGPDFHADLTGFRCPSSM
jgi:hypothetical protein